MKILVLVFTVAALASARPDIGLKLRAQQLANSYGTPTGSYLPPNYYVSGTGGHGTFGTNGGVTSGSGVYHTGSTLVGGTSGLGLGGAQGGVYGSNGAISYGSGSLGSSGVTYGTTGFGGISHGVNHGVNHGVSHGVTHGVNHGVSHGVSHGINYGTGSGYGGGVGTGNLGFTQNRFGGSFGGNYGANYGANYGSNYGAAGTYFQKTNLNIPAQVTKSVYFYALPDEPASNARVHVPVAPPRKNYKLIFIKAPTYGSKSQIYAPQQQDEEKTIVYVLVKNPDEAHDIVIPTPAPTPPAKPEVFYIKYKTEQEAHDKISNTLSGNQGDATYTHDLGSAKALVDTIQTNTAGTAQFITTGGVGSGYQGANNVGFSTGDATGATFFENRNGGSSGFGTLGVTSGEGVSGNSGFGTAGFGTSEFGASGISGVSGVSGLADHGVSGHGISGQGVSTTFITNGAANQGVANLDFSNQGIASTTLGPIIHETVTVTPIHAHHDNQGTGGSFITTFGTQGQGISDVSSGSVGHLSHGAGGLSTTTTGSLFGGDALDTGAAFSTTVGTVVADGHSNFGPAGASGPYKK